MVEMNSIDTVGEEVVLAELVELRSVGRDRRNRAVLAELAE